MIKAKHYITCIIIVLSTIAFANKIDSLKNILSLELPDTTRVIVNYKLGNAFININLDSAEWYTKASVEKAHDIDYKNLEFLAAFQLCLVEIYKEQYFLAVKVGEIALDLALENQKASVMNRIGAAYYYNQDFENALRSYTKSLNMAGDNEAKALANSGIGNVYYAQKKYDQALIYYQTGYEYQMKEGDQESIADCLINIGNVYDDLMQYDLAVETFEKSLEIYIKNDLQELAGLCMMNMGATQIKKDDLLSAKNNFSNALKKFDIQNDWHNKALCLFNIAVVAEKEKNFREAQLKYKAAIEIGQKLNNFDFLQQCYESLSSLYYSENDFNKAYFYHVLYVKSKDSLNAKLFNEKIAAQETKLKTKDKEIEIEKLNIEGNAKETQRNFLIVISILGLSVTFFVYRSYREKMQANNVLADKNTAIRKQKREIERQKIIVDIQNKDITDSINYAKQIQTAILPSGEVIKSALEESFVLYKPKAIVSGDFYFFSEKEGKVIMAVVDCTGHGVPGAFMSMIGHNLLSQIINENGITTPSEILNHLHIGVRKVLHQNDSTTGNRDGMDIALISIDKSMQKIEYAGANRPLYHIRSSVLNEIKSDKISIGGFQKEEKRTFRNNIIELQKGDTFYFFSDGYADQFGGEKGKKFMVKNLKKTFVKIHTLPLNEQERQLYTLFENWRGEAEQVDDVLVVGIKV